MSSSLRLLLLFIRSSVFSFSFLVGNQNRQSGMRGFFSE
jgi:hypothetical protein